MKIVLAPDKFKGSLTAQQVVSAMKSGILSVDTAIDIVECPLADGGEGSLAILEFHKAYERVTVKVRDPLFRPMEAFYLLDDKTAFIEMSLASGLQLLAPEERDPLRTSTFGTGELIQHAIINGAKNIFLFVGGSATNDGGCGMAEALGYGFLDEHGDSLKMTGGTLSEVKKIVPPKKPFQAVNFTVLTDVRNHLLGPNGASIVYGPQKGADSESINVMDAGLKYLAGLLNNGFENMSGSGAAGGLAYGAMSFLEAELRSGIDFMIEVTGFKEHIGDADLVISGEGKLDLQSLQGKVISGLAACIRESPAELALVCGQVEEKNEVIQTLGAMATYCLVNEDTSPKVAIENSMALVKERTSKLIREIK